MTNSSNGGQTDRLKYGQKKQILLELSQAVPLKEIADQYRTDVRTIQRARQWALKRPGFRSSLDQKVQDYLTDWERARSKKTVPTTSVVPENNANLITVTDKNHIDEILSKANIYSQFLEDHYKVLSTTALSIADLVHYVGIDNGEQTISQIVAKLSSWQSGQDPPAEQIEQSEELSDLLSSTEAKWLLSHIKYEAPELFVHFMHAHPKYLKYVSYKKPKSKNIDRWEEMTQDDVYAYGENLIDLLKLRAGRLDFKGTCEYCEGRK